MKTLVSRLALTTTVDSVAVLFVISDETVTMGAIFLTASLFG